MRRGRGSLGVVHRSLSRRGPWHMSDQLRHPIGPALSLFVEQDVSVGLRQHKVDAARFEPAVVRYIPLFAPPRHTSVVTTC